MPQSPAWVGPSYHWPFSLSEDSAVVVSAGAWGNYVIHAGASSPEIVGVDTFQFGMTYMQYAMRTSGGQTLLWGQSAYYEVLSLSDSGVCERLAVWQPEHHYSALTSHRDYGFAVLFVEPSSLQLARMDTTAQHIQNPPIGTFYWRDDEHIIEEGNLTIADDGRVMIVWSERTEGSPDATSLRIGTVGWTTPLNVSENFISHPSSLILSAYPNPFNAGTKITFILPRSADVTVGVYDILGRDVVTLYEGVAQAGTHDVQVTPGWPSGLYFVRLDAGDIHLTQKLVLLK